MKDHDFAAMAARSHFRISISARSDGSIAAAYIQLVHRAGKSARTEELISDILLADYDARGRMIGIEILGPVRLSALANAVAKPLRKPFARLVREGVPSTLLV